MSDRRKQNYYSAEEATTLFLGEKTTTVVSEKMRKLNCNITFKFLAKNQGKQSIQKFTKIYNPQNLAIKNVILKNFKILRNDPETKHIFSLPPLISFKHDKNLGNFLVRSAFKFNNQPGTFTCKRTRCKTCPFISNSKWTDRKRQ